MVQQTAKLAKVARNATNNKMGAAGKPSNRQLWARLCETDAALQAALEQLKVFRDLAYSDALTGLYNHRYFEERLNQEISRASRRDANCFSMLVIDLNDFKGINDSLGHLAGDAVLKKVAQCLTLQLRSYDVCCRTGGDEFMVILPDADPVACAATVARLRQGLEETSFEGLKVTLSIGSATWPTEGSTGAKLISAADAAMYADKRRQKTNRFVEEQAIDSEATARVL